VRGVKEVWRADLDRQRVFVSKPGGPLDQPHEREIQWKPAGLGRSFTLSLSQIFRDLP
jgi:Uma2 family endonuclease